ncbi:MAG: hypothetical protein KatS3mg110_2486 [Pirellulaceae bacterium]|nr:MAG: hypothetical protein KatS3mg110_2486 [Pirellulaceae bacterium]
MTRSENHWESRTNCPDCGGELTPIRMIDATERAMGSGVGHVELAYASMSSAPSDLSGTFPAAGVVRAKLCGSCGRIFLYAVGTAGGLNR